MELEMHINNVKSIKDLTFSFPLEKGLYAITGENASGKSTLVACASCVFFHMPMNEYFGKPVGNASIEFSIDNTSRKWEFSDNKWQASSSVDKMPISGFYEGSIIFGNRFKDTNFNALRVLDMIKLEDVLVADEFVRSNLGIILHNDASYYSNLYLIKENVKRNLHLYGSPYFYKTENGKLISQARMSTGENLLITILHSLNLRRNNRLKYNDNRPFIVFLDEIELALHASSLRRLLTFLKQISDTFNAAIFFSTHSLELIRDIKAQNIYYLDRQLDGSIMVTNPCYPAFATRNLYSDDGYGNDVVIFVEDDLAKCVIERVLFEKELLNNIRIKILPSGGWTNTLIMAHDVLSSKLLLRGTKVIVILDKDIQSQVPDFMNYHKECKYLEPDFLPISSLEKYLKNKLVDQVDVTFYKKLDNYVFQGRPLSSILAKYKTEVDISRDKDGKKLYGIIVNELRSISKERDELVEVVVKHLIETETSIVDALAKYISKKISDC
ncbi:MAG: AAA family ATPase [Clostridia bacterium]|nr:AAA family ATPase [Clostridia bacterium]